jgi:uncharacterized membrane protein
MADAAAPPRPLIPEVPPRRIVGVDVARALALVGMMATHIVPGRVGNDVTVVQQLAGGRASALFAVLAGVSVALVTGRTTPLRGRDRYAASVRLVVRALLVFGLGLLLGALPTWIAVILSYYGVLFLLALPFLGLGARALTLLAAGWALVTPVVSQLLRPHLPAHTTGSPSPSDLAHPLDLLSQLLFVGYYPAFTWVAYLLAGMALGRLDLRRRGTDLALLEGGLVLAVTSTVVSRILLSGSGARTALATTYPDSANPDPTLLSDPGALDATLTEGLHGTTPTGSWWWLATVAPHSGTPLDLAQTIGSALAVLGLCLLLTRVGRNLWAAVFGAGAMTLTLYSLHVAVMAQGYWPRWERPEDYPKQVVLVLAVGAFFALVPLKGPLETVVARLAQVAGSAVVGQPSTRVPDPPQQASHR